MSVVYLTWNQKEGDDYHKIRGADLTPYVAGFVEGDLPKRKPEVSVQKGQPPEGCLPSVGRKPKARGVWQPEDWDSVSKQECHQPGARPGRHTTSSLASEVKPSLSSYTCSLSLGGWDHLG